MNNWKGYNAYRYDYLKEASVEGFAFEGLQLTYSYILAKSFLAAKVFAKSLGGVSFSITDNPDFITDEDTFNKYLEEFPENKNFII